ncbi:MAG: hypothetical protein H8E44_06365 [Planctomycetes bacterium]|nr:hypothetical protein [Planctomycetota bacterium]MBL7044957.1 hypothetical protein [Pirellulaceae bacterium]
MKTITRRNFLGSTGTAGVVALTQTPGQSAVPQCDRVLRLSTTTKPTNPRDVKITVKPVGNYMIHDGVWTGPCRWDPNPPPEQERVQFKKGFDSFVGTLKRNLSSDVEILDPAYIEYSESEGYGEKQFRQLEADAHSVDAYFAAGNIYPQYAGSLIGERYKKPILMLGGYVPWDMSARLRSKGLEGYALADLNEAKELLTVLRARKTFQQTHLLLISDTPYKNRPAPSACVNFAELHERFGLEVTIVGYKEMAAERQKVMNNPASMEEVNSLTDALIEGAEEVRMKREGILPSVVMYRVVKNLIEGHGCNAFTMECFELCSSKLSHDWQFVPCLIHSLLKDEGYTSGCEGDINATMAMDLLMAVAKRAAFMGNFMPIDDTTMHFGHNVPALKMLGFDQPNLPYALQNYVRKGWGPKVQMDMAAFPEKTMTIARCDPLLRKILLVKGQITGCQGQNEIGCSLRVHIPVPSTKELVEKARNYGFHFAGVYGDYVQPMIQLAQMLKMEVETYNV